MLRGMVGPRMEGPGRTVLPVHFSSHLLGLVVKRSGEQTWAFARTPGQAEPMDTRLLGSTSCKK